MTARCFRFTLKFMVTSRDTAFASLISPPVRMDNHYIWMYVHCDYGPGCHTQERVKCVNVTELGC